jgi:hypothetical protein
VWKIDYEAFEKEISRPTENPFLEVLEADAEPGTSRYKQMEDLFYLTQIQEWV